jgi:hypothetical protein
MVKWYHFIGSIPLKVLSTLNLGPLGGESSISAVIETTLARAKGEEVNFELSKSDRFILDQFEKQGPPEDVIEYRAMNHLVQKEILKQWGDKRLGIIWIGAGVFTLEHPLLVERDKYDWHVWTDAQPRVVESALKRFNDLKETQKIGKLSEYIELPRDIDQLNEAIAFVAPNVDRLVIFGYGVTYALTIEENYQWLSQLHLPPDKDVGFVFNGPGTGIGFLPRLMAAFHNQRMVYYTKEDIQGLFQTAIPGSEIIWTKPRTETHNKMWETWLILSDADKR